jgi:hypothetical protein
MIDVAPRKPHIHSIERRHIAAQRLAMQHSAVDVDIRHDETAAARATLTHERCQRRVAWRQRARS